jgi:hypothetical protein
MNKIKKYHNVGTVPRSNIKIVERGRMDTTNTPIHDVYTIDTTNTPIHDVYTIDTTNTPIHARPSFWLCTDTSL